MIRLVIRSQYLAALAMLRAAVVACPDAQWGAAAGKNSVWDKEYHALFYVHLYVQPCFENSRERRSAAVVISPQTPDAPVPWRGGMMNGRASRCVLQTFH